MWKWWRHHDERADDKGASTRRDWFLAEDAAELGQIKPEEQDEALPEPSRPTSLAAKEAALESAELPPSAPEQQRHAPEPSYPAAVEAHFPYTEGNIRFARHARRFTDALKELDADPRDRQYRYLYSGEDSKNDWQLPTEVIPESQALFEYRDWCEELSLTLDRAIVEGLKTGDVRLNVYLSISEYLDQMLDEAYFFGEREFYEGVDVLTDAAVDAIKQGAIPLYYIGQGRSEEWLILNILRHVENKILNDPEIDAGQKREFLARIGCFTSEDIPAAAQAYQQGAPFQFIIADDFMISGSTTARYYNDLCTQFRAQLSPEAYARFARSLETQVLAAGTDTWEHLRLRNEHTLQAPVRVVFKMEGPVHESHLITSTWSTTGGQFQKNMRLASALFRKRMPILGQVVAPYNSNFFNPELGENRRYMQERFRITSPVSPLRRWINQQRDPVIDETEMPDWGAVPTMPLTLTPGDLLPGVYPSPQ